MHRFVGNLLLLVFGLATQGVLVEDSHENGKPIAVQKEKASEHVTKERDDVGWANHLGYRVVPAVPNELREHVNPGVEPHNANECEDDGCQRSTIFHLGQDFYHATKNVWDIVQKCYNCSCLPEIEEVTAAVEKEADDMVQSKFHKTAILFVHQEVSH